MKSIKRIWTGDHNSISLDLITESIIETLSFCFGLIDQSVMILSTGYNFTEDELDLLDWCFGNPEES